MIEREVKIRVADFSRLLPCLEAMGAIFAGSEEETNRMLDTAEGALTRRHHVLRVRSAAASTITWKGAAADHDPQGHKTREELEVEFAAEGTEELLSLLARLGYAEVLRYAKRRDTWKWQGAEITLDRLEFGNFVEIEGEAGVIQDALHRLQLDQEPHEQRSYPELQRLLQQQRERAT